jgi:hypothetical protein
LLSFVQVHLRERWHMKPEVTLHQLQARAG